eukprot:6553043-Heterocapsa_arctica.AAC.1
MLDSTSRSFSEYFTGQTSPLTTFTCFTSSRLRPSDGLQASAAHVRAGHSHAAPWTPVQRISTTATGSTCSATCRCTRSSGSGGRSCPA